MERARGDYTAGRPASERETSTSSLVQLAAIPFGFVAPLIGYPVLRDRSEFLRQSLRSALNFQLTVLLAALVVGVATVVALASTGLVPASADYYAGLTVALAGLLLVATAIGVTNAICCILGALRAGRGIVFRYPLTIHFVR